MQSDAKLQDRLLTEIRQLTFTGKRAGEGYFSSDGKRMVFQSERDPENPFFQIFLMDRETGDTHRISPGVGKTTCAWIHPDNQRVLFASTQYDPEAINKQRAEIEFRSSGQSRRYSWDYDPQYELVEFDLRSQQYRRLTEVLGYDAEASYSPDGRLICFASNRRAHEGQLNDREKELFEQDPSSAIDLYIMNADGSQVRRLTDSIGYDGGPFFSPDGQTICWRRFKEDGATAEVMVMQTDGSQQRPVTQLGALSWAPFFHPSGKYLIFATNLHGFNNFELYMVALSGGGQPVRVTYRDGFDGLPVFTPDGKSLVWTSNAGTSQSQLWEASWNHLEACRLLGLAKGDAEADASVGAAQQAASTSVAEISAADIGRHVDYLCRPELGGRLTGTPGEQAATAYVAAYLEHLGLKPAGDGGTFFHEFQFTSSVKLGGKNQLVSGETELTVDQDWRPLSFSRNGPIDPSDLVFAGYGIVAPGEANQPQYDSYVHLDVENKWVVMLRRMPQDITAERRQYFSRFSHDRYKAMVARERGAKGVVLVSGPHSQFRSELIPLRMDGSLGSSSLGVISVTNQVAEGWLKAAGEDLSELQKELDTGEMMMGFPLTGVQLSGTVDVSPVVSRGRNVLALMQVGSQPADQMVVVGAHIDHLGEGTGSSLAKENEAGAIHRGADDNASGVACMVEIAEYLSDLKRRGQLAGKRDVLFAAWSGEELGLHGSAAFVDDCQRLYPQRFPSLSENSVDRSSGDSSGQSSDQKPVQADGTQTAPATLYPQISAYLNMDMVGRLRENLVLQGIGSSPYWSEVIERRNAVTRLPLNLQADCHLPTDATSFFLKGVPILSAFTGSHDEYHTPRDVPELLNYDGASQVARLMALLLRDLIQVETPPSYQQQAAQPEMRANLTAYLGTVPDYGKTDIRGVKLGGVTKGAPAEVGGLLSGDVIVELAGRAIENIYDYTYAIEALKVGQPVTIKVQRADATLELQVTPTSRN
jgi:Tol biopolymer transport system component